MPFKVIDKRNETIKIRDVYNIRIDKNGFPQFLIYETPNGWVYRSAKFFEPI